MLTAYEKELVIEGMRLYAWWKDGVQYVGTSGKTLAEAIAELDEPYAVSFVNPKSRTKIQDAMHIIDTYTRITALHKPPIQVSNAIIVLKSLLLERV